MEIKEIYNWDTASDITDMLPDETFGIIFKLSGGADSSILYYTVCKELAEKNLNIPVYVASLDTETKPWYSHYAKKVIKFTTDRTGISPVEHNIKFLPNPWTLEDYGREQDEIAFKTIREGKANVWFGGLTQNPPIEDQAKAAFGVDGIKYNSYNDTLNGCKQKDLNRDDLSKKNVRDFELLDGVHLFYTIHPFVHLDKKYSTAALYIKHNVLDDLLPLTYSCEEEYNESNKVKLSSIIRDDIYEEEHCGRCWFCLERAYAFKRLV